MSANTYQEEYHDNCHDYLKSTYIIKHADPRYIEFLNVIKNNIKRINICGDTPVENYGSTLVCDQRCVIISNAYDKYPIIATYALNACVCLILYDRKNKIGAVAHIDGLVGYSNKTANKDGYHIKYSPIARNVEYILEAMRKISGSKKKLKIEYYVIGGIFGLSEILVYDIVFCFRSLDNDRYIFSFKGRNILGPANQTRNICFDTRTGNITYFSYLENYDFHSNYTIREPSWIPPNIIPAKEKYRAKLSAVYISKKPDVEKKQKTAK